MSNPATQQSAPTSRTVTFDAGKVYEVTGIWVKEGQEAQLQDYFGKVFPIAAAKHGVKPVFSIEPVNVYAGDFSPHMMFVSEWPSTEAFKAFANDPEATALFPQRDAVVERLVVTHYKVPDSVSVELTDGDVIEFGAMWIKPGREQDLQAYYAKAVAIAKNHQLRPMTRLAPVNSYRGDFMPTGAGFNNWGTLENFKSFAKEASSLFPERDATLDRLEVMHGKVHFRGEN